MRKRIMSILCICMCILGLAACGTDPKKIDYNGMSYEELETNALTTWESIQAMDVAQLELIIAEIDGWSEAKQIAFFEENEGTKEELVLMKSWVEVSKQVGAYVGVDSFTVTKSGKSTTTDLILQFEERPVVLSVVYKNRDMSVENTTVDLVYSTGEKMQRALMNTVMGMGTVFVMLIVISLIISAFSVIPKIEKKMKERKEQKNAIDVVESTEALPVQEYIPETDDLELVAVIAAAIAASTGQSTDDFVVRSIKRR